MSDRAHWESVYRHKSPDCVSWYQAEPRQSLELIERSGIDPGQRVVDVGGGASVLVDRLLERSFTGLSVLDISARALEHAKARLGADASRIDWIVGDIREFRPHEPYALWHDRAVLHFLIEPAAQARYAAVLRQALQPGGTAIIAAFAVGGPARCSGLDIRQYDAGRLLTLLGADFELIEETTEAHETPAGAMQLFAWFRLRRLS